MEKALIDGYGTVNFDPMNPDGNEYELWCVCICEGEQVIWEEHYLKEDQYQLAINNVFGRELMNELNDYGTILVDFAAGTYFDCPAIFHYAYVVDHEEEEM